jgi:ribonuclease HI
MLIAIDGACKRNGQPTCSSSGVAWIQTEDGHLLFKSRFETCSTNQRGEINGLREALLFASTEADEDEDIIIVTDSEYLYNTVSLDWCFKWKNNNWVGATGPVKNADMWSDVCSLLERLPGRVFMQWTKGHLMSYTPGSINQAMRADPTGIELYTRVLSIANRGSEHARLIKDFIRERVEHDKSTVPDEIAIEWLVANTVADCLASYVVRIMDELQA